MKRVFNFSAGPAQLPLDVLIRAQEELLSYQNIGMSIMEISHRSIHFKKVIERVEELMRELLQIPDNYKVLFIQGGASLQFSMVPLNLFKENKHASYVHSGSWSKKAIAEASKFGDIHIIASSEEQQFTYFPSFQVHQLNENTNYLHITTNNTIEGTRFTCTEELPKNGIPVVADMSSNILSEELDVSQYGLIYAGAQKNLGIAGLTIVIIREDLVGNTGVDCPTMLNYETYAKAESLYNTPPTFSIYMTMLVLEWLKELGGIPEIAKRNIEKAKIFYDFLDTSSFFSSNVKKADRSLMNIPFTTVSKELNSLFIQIAEQEGFYALKGHRSVGGMRASLYNAMPLDAVLELVAFMKQFEEKYA
ncbi:3-phosphoserine/phosphohydroxythreonine transaminase [Caldibacillus lycopersici]|uniref:Phosphoserine aminotransferase n=1 Tax=Perspicuibacillus lycopersici TaxID=1325689 RepID=A0AAE3LSK6_9BACI|nr:3-phosphoserine/phosphohydroxythreonine transaminase [Perspicuibacillus lycopersici]MCU9612838.1 3-phosphoserine/phosphohydroxythreonine transaminase [Perspicuibacillus lycopersici]